MMKKIVVVFIIFSFIAGAVGFMVVNNFGRKGMANLVVNSSPSLEVFVDGVKVGNTPYSGTHIAKKTAVRVGNYESEFFLQSGIKTIVNREFDESLSQSFGEILSFEKTNLATAALAVISDPAGGDVKIDEKGYGDTPLVIDNLAQGQYKLSVSLSGFKEKEFAINLVTGYKLVAFFDLLASKPLGEEKSEVKVETKERTVQILSTPNGFLRVRSRPTTASEEMGRVHPNEKYNLISVDEKTGWFKIQLNATASGWISNVYSAIQNPDNEANPN